MTRCQYDHRAAVCTRAMLRELQPLVQHPLWIVDLEWLEECRRTRLLLDPTRWLVPDPA